MKRTLIIILCTSLIVFFFSSFIHVDEKKPLFKIVRSKDKNEIWYVLNKKADGSINKENPIIIYWIKKSNGNKKEPLTWIQSRYAYGIKYINSETKKSNEWHFQFVSYSKRTLILRKTEHDIYKVFTKSNNKEVEVNQVYIQIDGGTFWVPKIPFVKLTCIDTKTGVQIIETVNT